MKSVRDNQAEHCRSGDIMTKVEMNGRKTKIDDFRRKFKNVYIPLGLVLLVSLHAVTGGFLFRYLEQTNEINQCEEGELQYNDLQKATINRMWAIASNFQSKDDKQIIEAELNAIYMHKYVSHLSNYCANKIEYSRQFCYFTGYGNIAPRTFWGRFVCIAYAVLGIPLMLLCLANIGEIMANVFRYVYFNVFCCGCNCFRRRVVKTRPKSTKPTPGGTGESETDAWKNRYNKQSDSNRTTEDIAVVDDDAKDDQDEDEEENKLSVPLTINIGMLAIYVFMGAMLFSVWNPSWDWLIGAYFCFVTISTIGFGDFVPGYSNNAMDLAAQLQMVVAAVYMVFGMALMSMAFNLIQEEMASRFTLISGKMGLVKSDKDEKKSRKKTSTKKRKAGRQFRRCQHSGPGPDHKLTPPGGGPPTAYYYVSHNKSD